MALSYSDIIGIAKISQFLAANDVAKGSLFGGRISPNTPKILYMERMAVEWMYNIDPSDSSLTLTANYLYSLCRGYNLAAQGILNQGGGGQVSPINITTAPNQIEFNVGASTLLATGATSCTISAYTGFNIILVRGGVPQTTVNEGGGASYYSWDRDLAQLVVSPQVYAGELIQIYPI